MTLVSLPPGRCKNTYPNGKGRDCTGRTDAPQAAGANHGDCERGFIRAQTIAFDDFIQYKGEQGAKEAGKMRAEGKDYVVKDGDVMNFLFNV